MFLVLYIFLSTLLFLYCALRVHDTHTHARTHERQTKMCKFCRIPFKKGIGVDVTVCQVSMVGNSVGPLLLFVVVAPV